MKRLLLSCCILLCVVLTLKAQEQPLISPDDSIRSLVGRLFPNSNPNLSAHMNLQFSTSGVANFIEGDLEDASFKLNRVKLEILGSFSKQFSYHFRQSFNKYSNPHSLDNLSSSIEYALVNWKMSDKFTLTAGKQDIADIRKKNSKKELRTIEEIISGPDNVVHTAGRIMLMRSF